VTSERDHEDARALLAAAYVLGRRADAKGKRTFTVCVLIRTLERAAERITR
jgi:hypothetical protein